MMESAVSDALKTVLADQAGMVSMSRSDDMRSIPSWALVRLRLIGPVTGTLDVEHGRLPLLQQNVWSRGGCSARSASAPAIQMISATTTDSKSVTIDYTVNQAADAGSDPVRYLSLKRRQIRFK